MSYATTPIPSRYPDSLPCPTAAPMRPTERRRITELPGQKTYRAFQRDFHGTQDVEFMLNAAQADVFASWWRDTLRRGGGWFAADWPLLFGRTGNVYRFVTTPAWTFIIDGRAGMHRVSAQVEIRGIGELPAVRDLVILTTPPYPIQFTDELAIDFAARKIDFIYWPTDSADIGFTAIGAVLRAPLITYPAPPEPMDIGFTALGAVLRAPLVTYSVPPEPLDVGFSSVSGTLRVALIRYQNWPAEPLDVGFTAIGATLT